MYPSIFQLVVDMVATDPTFTVPSEVPAPEEVRKWGRLLEVSVSDELNGSTNPGRKLVSGALPFPLRA